MKSFRYALLLGSFSIAACEPSIRNYGGSGGGGTNTGGMGGIGGMGGMATVVCGDNQIGAGEECESGGVNTEECDSDCTFPACADGIFNPTAEPCDDGNTTIDGNGCNASCQQDSVCGDGIVQSFFEACDDGGQVDGDECSADCKRATLALIPVSDRGGGDFDSNGTWDGLNEENSTGEAVAWVDPEERRIAFELDTSKLPPTVWIEAAVFDLHTCCLSGMELVQLHGYQGNGLVELSDMTAENPIAEFPVADQLPLSIDVQGFMQTVAKSQWPFTGFLLRLGTKANGLFNLGVSTSNAADPAQQPRLKLTFCVDADQNGVCD